MKFPQNGVGMKFPQTIRGNCILFIILRPGLQEVTNGSIKSELEKETSEFYSVESARSVNCEIKDFK